MLLYRLPEAFLLKMVNPFLLDTRAKGGLELSTENVGFVYGTIGVIFLTVGGIIGGMAASRWGLKKKSLANGCLHDSALLHLCVSKYGHAKQLGGD